MMNKSIGQAWLLGAMLALSGCRDTPAVDEIRTAAVNSADKEKVSFDFRSAAYQTNTNNNSARLDYFPMEDKTIFGIHETIALTEVMEALDYMTHFTLIDLNYTPDQLFADLMTFEYVPDYKSDIRDYVFNDFQDRYKDEWVKYATVCEFNARPHLVDEMQDRIKEQYDADIFTDDQARQLLDRAMKPDASLYLMLQYAERQQPKLHINRKSKAACRTLEMAGQQ